MSVLTFTVEGVAQPAGSKRAYVFPPRREDQLAILQRGGSLRALVTDANAKSKPWQRRVAMAAQRARDAAGMAVLDGPLALRVDVYLERPKGHYGTGRNAGVVKASAPPFPASRPDATKLLRGIEDALTGVVWGDDAQVVRQMVQKLYGSPRVVVSVVPMAPAGHSSAMLPAYPTLLGASE